MRESHWLLFGDDSMKHELFKIYIDDISKSDLEARLFSFLKSDKTNCIATPNAEMLIDSLRDEKFRSDLQVMDLNLQDAVALRFAVSALTDDNLRNRNTGVDTLKTLIEICAREGKSVLFFGASKEVADEAIEKLDAKADIDSVDPGIVRIEDGQLHVDRNIIDQINKIEPSVIAIALPHKKQLAFMGQFKKHFPSVRIMIGIGGALDMYAGKHKRAPRWMRKIGMEWLWRVLIEPSRIGRIAKASIVFPVRVAVETIRQKRFLKAIYRTFPEIISQLTGK